MSISDQIQKATNERLTSEDWQALIAACDSMNDASPADQTKGFQALYKRLESPVGNAQMYGLTLLNALAQSGGPRIKSTIASQETRRVLSTVLSSPHRAVRDRAKDIVKDLDEALQNSEFSKWSTTVTRQSTQHAADTGSSTQDDDEEEQIRRAIRLSMQDQPAPRAHAGAHSSASDTSVQTTSTHTRRAETPTDSNSEIVASVHKSPKAPAAAATAPAAVEKVKTLYAYSSDTNGDLNFRAGEIIQVVDSSHKDWWKGSLNGVVGVFPSNYVELVSDQPIATEEDYIFAQAPNVERLLSIFASASQQPGYSIVGNPDLQAMYDEVMALRPQLLRMIDEYGARKQKLMKLNGDIGDARQRYEQLVNARMVPQPAGAFQFENYERERERAAGAPSVAPADAPIAASAHLSQPLQGRVPSTNDVTAHAPAAPYAAHATHVTHPQAHAQPHTQGYPQGHTQHTLSPSAPIYPDYSGHHATAPSAPPPVAQSPASPLQQLPSAPQAPVNPDASEYQHSSKLPYPI